MTHALHAGSVEAVLPTLDAGSFDGCLCDPPYGLSFMGKAWDHGVPGPEIWREVLRVLKPGAHLLAFGGTRTFHRLACAIEDAGFELRDCIGFGHLKPAFCRCSPVPYSHADDAMRDLPEAGPSGTESPCSDGDYDLLAGVQRTAPRPRVGNAWKQGQGGVDCSLAGVLPGEDARAEKPGMEGRSDVLPEARELPADSLRAGSGLGASDGENGRLRDGAPPPHGQAVRLPAGEDGSGSPFGPQPPESSTGEPRALAVEWIPQGGGAWPACPLCHLPLEPPFDAGPLAWVTGQGFPKSLDISKAIDKAAGAAREVIGERSVDADRWTAGGRAALDRGEPAYKVSATTATTPEAARFSGYGTALKPAWEPVIVAMKPLDGTFAANALAHGVAGLNVDGCRILSTVGDPGVFPRDDGRDGGKPGYGGGFTGGASNALGRWPANVLLDPESARLLDHQSGEQTSGVAGTRSVVAHVTLHGLAGTTEAWGGYGDSGGASRMFYCAKSHRGERELGLYVAEKRKAGAMNGAETRPDRPTNHPLRGNHHPTVKPLDLCEYLARLILPPARATSPRRLLVPFAGSGSEMIGGYLAGWDELVGIEREAEYVAIAEARLAYWTAAGRQTELPRELLAAGAHA